MAEYIGLKSVLTVVDDWLACGNIGDKKPTLKASIRAIPIADVIEREKIDKAIEEIQRIHDDTQQKVNYAYERDGFLNEKADLACFIYRDCLRILKKHIGGQT